VQTLNSLPLYIMPGKAGGKAKPLKQAKAADKNLSPEDIKFHEKQKADRAAEAALKKKIAGGKK
jgi:hypothetical protein